jgi:hypothetical protein
MQNLTIDYSTDTKGRILSMSYNEIGDYSGELFYTFDSFGNTVALTDAQGNVIAGYLYDLNNGAIKSEYNPQGIDNQYKGGGKEGSLTFSVDSSTNIILDLIGNDYIISNPWGNAADEGATNGEGEFELITVETGGFCFMFVGDRVFIPSGGYAMDCKSFKTNGDKLGQDIVDYFKGIGKTDSEICDIEDIVGYCGLLL